ncbi:MAG: hypothetical protein ABW215_20930 [Kibdelosporangium sp.]
MNDRNVNIGGSVGGSFQQGDNSTFHSVTSTPAEVATTRQDLLAQLESLRTQLEKLGETGALSRVDDLEEEASASEVDSTSGVKAFDRLKKALTGVSAVAGLVAGIEDHVRALFS